MGGVKKLINKAVKEGVIKVEPKNKTPEEGKKTSDASDKKLTENDKKAKEAAAALLIKKKGRKKTILTSASGLDEDEISTKKTMLGG